MSQPADERNIEQGVAMLLKLSRNRILCSNILNRPEKFKDKLFYELGKYLKIRLNNDTLKEVAQMVKTVNEEVAPELKKTAGKREDHDQLTETVQALYTENATLLHEMRDLHTKLRLKSGPGSKPCERYDDLQLLLDKFKKYRENWITYDKAVPGQEPEPKTQEPEQTILADPKKISAARKYLSDNKAKLMTLKNDTEKQDKYKKLLENCQNRYELLINMGQSISEEQLKELQECGITVK